MCPLRARLVLFFQDFLHTESLFTYHECDDRSSCKHWPLLNWIHLPDRVEYEDPHEWGNGLDPPFIYYKCPKGSYCTAGALVDYKCLPGTFMDIEGHSDPKCKTCIAGTMCPRFGMIIGDACEKGHYCPAGTIRSMPCPPGKFTSLTNAKSESECSSCTPGYFCGTWGLSAPTGTC